jgi:hypothetical protein
LVVSVALFTLLFGRLINTGELFRAGPLLFIFRFTMMFALPIWCLYLPFVIVFKDAVGRRLWAIQLSGSLIGPASFAIWGLILQLRGADPHEIWYGDPLLGVLGGVAAAMVYALIVGFLTTCLYVIALRVLFARSTATRG